MSYPYKRPPDPDQVMMALFTMLYHFSMGTSVALVGLYLGYKAAAAFAVALAVAVEFNRAKKP